MIDRSPPYPIPQQIVIAVLMTGIYTGLVHLIYGAEDVQFIVDD